MAKNIEPKLKKIGDYLKLDEDTVFTIPEYQRAYSWSIDNCDKLWQDINDFVDSDSKDRYFFGTIIINCQDDDTKYGLIDGQQRTTTFLLLLKALLVRINTAIERTSTDDDSAALCRGLQERRRRIMGILYKAETEDIPDKPDRTKDAEICHNTTILVNHSINEQFKTELNTILQATDYDSAEVNVIRIKYKQKDNRYTNFFRNFKFFYSKISDLSDSQLNTIAKSIVDNCEVIEIKSWQVEQAITMFNSLNSDGLPLYDSDIISAKLYAEAEKCGKEKEFTALWKQLNEVINELDNIGVANINSILMQYMYYVRTVNLAATGARVSELIQIKIEHIEIGYFDLYTKGGKLRRLYISKKLKIETLKWLEETNRSSGYLFLNRYGERITTRGISQQLKNYADKYGLDKKVVYPHSFRHRYAKNFLEKYNDIALLADLMGHESIETTRIYLRRTASEQQALVDKIVTW